MTSTRLRNLVASLALALFAAATPVQAQLGPVGLPPGGARPETPPIAATGHGTLFAPDGQALRPTRELLAKTVEFYLRTVIGENAANAAEKMAEMDRNIGERVQGLDLEPAIRRSVLLDWLIQETRAPDADRIAAILTALRRSYFTEILKLDPREARLHLNSGLPEDIRVKLADIGIVTYTLTGARGEEYFRECLDAGVPHPPDWKGRNLPTDYDRGKWKFIGAQTINFASSAPTSHVYVYDTARIPDQPNGICMALPRISGSTISLLGIICLGRDTGKACFWDNADIGIDEDRPISEWKGGVDLGGLDICSDCHAGESPYVVHPGTALDIGAAQDSPVWYEPLVKAEWPQNPGPTALLDFLPLGPMEGDCRNCHNQGYAGRLPEVGALKEYCTTVLSKAVVQTMPPGMPGDPAYAKHINAMKAFCQQRPPDGTVVTAGSRNENLGFISPPVVVRPLYACASAVEVRGGIYGAKLTVFIGGTQVAQADVTRPSGQIIAVPPLVATQEVIAVQEKDGVVSGPSAREYVRNHREDYADGLPRPRIDPTLIHECGRTIAVRHVRGAEVTVFTNDISPVTYTTGGDWTNLPPAVWPFVLNDGYTASQALCGDGSMSSGDEVAVAPPAPMPLPATDPATVYPGQEVVGVSNLAPGALTRVEVDGTGAATQFTTAVSWNPEVDIATPHGGPLSAGQNFVITSELCREIKTRIPVAQTCNDLPPPVIAPPFVGNMHIDVLDSIAGARILVYDGGGAEIGDGSGATVGLSRAIVPGDVLTVVQRIAECTSKEAYQISALCTSIEQGCRG